MAKKLDEVDQVQQDIHNKHKAKLTQYQNEVDLREMEISRKNKILETKETDLTLLNTKLSISDDRCKDLEDEMELKSGENNRLRKQVADIEVAM
jgi:hypothetical protein